MYRTRTRTGKSFLRTITIKNTPTMIVYINNKDFSFEGEPSIAQAIKQVEGIPDTGIAIALNNDVIPASQWPLTKLSDGDRITIIKAFYGG